MTPEMPAVPVTCFDDLDAHATFAVLGPGFRDGRVTALTGLRAPNDSGALAFALLAFEEPGAGPHHWFTGDAHTLAPPPRDGVGLEPDPLDATGYDDAIGAIREAIHRGEVYQANFTRFVTLGRVRGREVFRALTRQGMAPYACWLRLPSGLEVVSASPECLFRIEGHTIVSEPMKGTAKLEAERDLLASRKDDAELAMITDLVRHELATQAVEKTVRVLDERRVVRLPYALQTIARVAAELPRGYSLEGVLAAMHPAGSVVGAPKRTALDLVRRLESAPRGPYCGTLVVREGAKAAAGVMIRTAFRASEREPFRYGTGSGVTWSSEAAREFAELDLKVSALR
jgi:para-aminobenzoate synthetase component 1